MPEKISAVILNYKHLDDTLKCLGSLMGSGGGGAVDYYVVDNSPEAPTEKLIKSKFPKVNYIVSKENPGFAAGNNKAIRKILARGSDYVLIINPDVTVGKHFFIPLLKHFKNNKEVGIVAPVISHTQKGKRVFGLEGRVDWSLAKPKHRNLTKIKNLSPIISEFVTFACVIIRKETFREAGLLDEGYFMYFEDVDYCLTAGRVGYKIILDPKVIVKHRTSSSFSRPTQKLSISFWSHLRFIKKWLPVSRRIKPYFYAFTIYPYLYILWTYQGLKYKNV